MSHTLPSVPGGLDSVYFQERPGNPQDTQKPLCLLGAGEKRLQPNLEKAGSAPGGGGGSGTGGRRRSSDDPAPRLTDAALSPAPAGLRPAPSRPLSASAPPPGEPRPALSGAWSAPPFARGYRLEAPPSSPRPALPSSPAPFLPEAGPPSRPLAGAAREEGAAVAAGTEAQADAAWTAEMLGVAAGMTNR